MTDEQKMEMRCTCFMCRLGRAINFHTGTSVDLKLGILGFYSIGVTLVLIISIIMAIASGRVK